MLINLAEDVKSRLEEREALVQARQSDLALESNKRLAILGIFGVRETATSPRRTVN